MKLNLDSEWQAILADEIEKPYFHDLMEVDEEYKLHACCQGSCFSAFNYCSFNKVKVVIIGQDPYHGKGG
jgi:uracil-DNA glycosylase